MKTALVFTGTGRSLEHTHENLKNNLIAALDDCDIFLLIADNPHAPKVKKYFNLPNVKKHLVEKEPEYDLSKYRFQPGWPPSRSSKQIYIKMLNSRTRCGEILTAYEKENDIEYERVVFSRLDINYFDNISTYIKNLDLNNLYIPDFHNTYGGWVNGYNDRFAISNRDNMRTYLNIVESISPFVRQGGELHGETFLKWHLKINQINVKLIPVRFTRVRTNGEEIDKRIRHTSSWYFDEWGRCLDT